MTPQVKTCSSCNRTLPLTEFNRKGRGRQQSKCRSCQKIWYKAYYESNAAERERLAKNRDSSREIVRVAVRELKSVPCMDCGESYPYYVMDFDHRDPSTKKFNIGEKLHVKSLRAILDEVSKCDVVCSNCHRIRTHSMLAGGIGNTPHSE